MDYQHWKLLHLLGVFAFLLSHGVSVGVALRIRKERDPGRVLALLQLSGSSVGTFYVSLLVLVLAGVVMGFLRDWWSHVWLWAAIAVLVLTMVAMYVVARPYYRKIRLIAGAMAEGSKAVTDQQFAELLMSPRMWVVLAIGVVGLGLILWLMIGPIHPFGTF